MFSNFRGSRPGMSSPGLFAQPKAPVYGGSVGDTVGPEQADQSRDLYSKMAMQPAQGSVMGGKAQSGPMAPGYDQLMRAAIQQRRMRRPGAQPVQQASPAMAAIPPKGSGLGVPEGYSK